MIIFISITNYIRNLFQNKLTTLPENLFYGLKSLERLYSMFEIPLFTHYSRFLNLNGFSILPDTLLIDAQNLIEL